MKKMSLKWMLLTLLSCSFALFACSKDEDTPGEEEPEKATLSVSAPATGLEFDAAEGTVDVTITTNQMEWKATMENATDTVWCKLSQKDKVLTVKVLENVKETSRSGKIMLVAGSGDNTATAEIAVGQSLPAATLTLDPSTPLEFGTSEGTKMVTITTNRSTWTAELVKATDAEWCILTLKDNTLTVKVLKNTNADREAEIKVTAGSGETGKSLPITVKQKYEVLATYNLLDVYEKDGVKGIIFELNEDKTGGKIMSLTGLINEFKNAPGVRPAEMGVLSEANSVGDGMHNTKKIKEFSTDWHAMFPGIAWAEDMNKDGVTGWHIPAQNDVETIWNLYANNKNELNGILTSAGGEQMVDGVFSTVSGLPYEHVLCSSTIGMYDGYGAVWSIGYRNKNNPTLGDYKSGFFSLFNADPTVYQFRAIHKF